MLYVVDYGFDTSMWPGCNGPFDGMKQDASGETLLKRPEVRFCSRTFYRPIKTDPHTNPPRISYSSTFVLRNWPRFSCSVSRLCHFRSHSRDSRDTNDHCGVPQMYDLDLGGEGYRASQSPLHIFRNHR